MCLLDRPSSATRPDMRANWASASRSLVYVARARTQAVIARPTLLGLDAETSLRTMVEYLQANDYTREQILEFVTTTL